MKFTIKDFHAKYPHDSACLDEIFHDRYGQSKTCPACRKETSFYHIADRKSMPVQIVGSGFILSPIPFITNKARSFSCCQGIVIQKKLLTIYFNVLYKPQKHTMTATSKTLNYSSLLRIIRKQFLYVIVYIKRKLLTIYF